ncbi:hypothetical protein C8Q73DRAFT_2947 [Cubamyces lactineus]|nr:hypothetical protein C8Q73DRAFT_2947 [Cubamyces lactineus]
MASFPISLDLDNCLNRAIMIGGASSHMGPRWRAAGFLIVLSTQRRLGHCAALRLCCCWSLLAGRNTGSCGILHLASQERVHVRWRTYRTTASRSSPAQFSSPQWSSQLSMLGQSQHHLSTPIISHLPLDTPAMRSRRTSVGARRLVGGTNSPALSLPFSTMHKASAVSLGGADSNIIVFIDVPSTTTHLPSIAYQNANRYASWQSVCVWQRVRRAASSWTSRGSSECTCMLQMASSDTGIRISPVRALSLIKMESDELRAGAMMQGHSRRP